MFEEDEWRSLIHCNSFFYICPTFLKVVTDKNEIASQAQKWRRGPYWLLSFSTWDWIRLNQGGQKKQICPLWVSRSTSMKTPLSRGYLNNSLQAENKAWLGVGYYSAQCFLHKERKKPSHLVILCNGILYGVYKL